MKLWIEFIFIFVMTPKFRCHNPVLRLRKPIVESYYIRVGDPVPDPGQNNE